LAQSAEKSEEIDLERAKDAMARAEKRLADRSSEDIDFVRARAALERSLVRIKLSSGQI
jgi:F-type H+-transporting ATPase subunit epsilon